MSAPRSALTGLPHGTLPALGAAPPRAPFVALAAIAAIVMAGVAMPSGHGAIFPVSMPPAAVQAARSLRFVELPHDDLAVYDAASRIRIAMIPAAQNGFLHAVVHGLQVTRRRAGVAPDRAYHLALYGDGRLVLTDPPTRTSIDVEGFGPTNMAGILAFLGPERARS